MPTVITVTLTKLTKEEAIKNNVYFHVTKDTTAADLEKFFLNHTNDTVYVTSINNTNYLLFVFTFHNLEFMIYNADTFEEIAEIADFSTTQHMLLIPKETVPEISYKNVSVFLDTYNIAYYNDASLQMLYDFPDKPYTENTKITGKQYFEKVQDLIKTAQNFMEYTDVETLFQKLPLLNKNSTFPVNCKFIIYKNGLITATAYTDHVEKSELMLCLVTKNVWTYPEHLDLTESVSHIRARLCIISVNGAKKITPLLSNK